MRPKKIFIVGSIFIFVGICFGLISLGIYIYDREFKKNAVETTAKVIDIQKKKNNTSTKIVYEADKDVIEKNMKVYNSNYYVGKEIQIFYSKENPKKIIDETHPLLITVFGIVAGSIFTIGTFVCFYAVDKRAKRRKSLQEQQ